LPLTAATAVALLAHVTTRPVSGAPPASFGVAVSCTVPPTSTLGAAGLTVTVATGRGAGAATVASTLPLLPSQVAVIVAAPAAIPVTRPVLLTVATAGTLLVHVRVRPVMALPLTSFGVAVNCSAAPTRTLGAAGLTVTVTTTLSHGPPRRRS